MSFVKKIMHGRNVEKFFSDKEDELENPIPKTEEEIELVSILESIPVSDWRIDNNSMSKLSESSIFRIQIETTISNELIKVENEGDLAYLDIISYDAITGKLLYLFQNINSEIIENIFREVMRRDNPYYSKIEEKEKKFEDSKLKELTKDMKDNLFRADYNYAERTGILSPKYNDWRFKTHKYLDRNYFDTLEVGKEGYVIREYDGKHKYSIYKCKIIDKFRLSKKVIFEVYEMIRCKNNILDNL